MAADPAEHPAVRRVTTALTALGATGRVRVLDDAARTAVQAAAALGVEVGQIASSLVFLTVPAGGPPGEGRHLRSPDAEPLLVLTSGAHRVDVTKVAALLGLAGLARPDADVVRAATGFAIGGVAPVAHPAPLRTLVDVALSRYDVVWAAAGHPHVVFPTSYDELIRITGGRPAEVG
ncbi:MAG: YbaK/EbsC family protein [Rhodoferax sp.]|nr:YbaK/EbsC family protein [Actinomycetota bacterium]